MIGIGLLLGMAAACLFQNWQSCLKIALTIVVVEGALRKWVFPGQEMAILFLKDVALLICYWKHFSERGMASVRLIPAPLLGLLGLTFVVASLNTLNPSLSSAAVGVFGLKAYFYYVPLLWVGADFFERAERFEDFAAMQMRVALPVFALAFLQFFAPADSILNIYASSSTGERLDAATVGEAGNVRVTGTFPYISGMGCFVNLVGILALYMFIFSARKRSQTLGLITLTMTLIVGLMTGSRSVVFFLLAMIMAALFLARNVRSGGGVRILRILLVGAILALVVQKTSALLAVHAFIQRVQTTADTVESVMGPLPATWEVAEVAGITGFGTGATHQARSTIERALDIGTGDYPPELYEWEYPRIMLELGPIGFFLWFGCRVLFMILPLFLARNLHSKIFRSFAMLLGASMLMQYTIPNVFNHVYSLYFWLLSGLALALQRWSSAVELPMSVDGRIILGRARSMQPRLPRFRAN